MGSLCGSEMNRGEVWGDEKEDDDDDDDEESDEE
jgi:hypothetical protein